jgi:hypothetical protein
MLFAGGIATKEHDYDAAPHGFPLLAACKRSPLCGYSLNLWFVWIMALRSSLVPEAELRLLQKGKAAGAE